MKVCVRKKEIKTGKRLEAPCSMTFDEFLDTLVG